ncbi:MAG TPA: PA0069 family radical SAM protein [Burkholderiaceae bacterium]|nr:PA0069 family radical SAM protein [Burkholderiaceae bacterium]
MKPVRSALLAEAFADLKGRGARSNRDSRFAKMEHELDAQYLEVLRLEATLDPVQTRPAAPGAPLPVTGAPIKTSVTLERARSIISRNDSPDIPFDRSVNPYRGCEHGCVYCYARPTHAYLGLSAGLDFETRLFAKNNAAELLERELRKPGYVPAMLALGANTDPYQPIEKEHRITRSVLEVLASFGHPVAITTKSALILRDHDLLAQMAQRNLVRVLISIGSLDRTLARTLEPRASTPARRLEAIGALAQLRIPVGVIVAPVIPALNESSLEPVLEAAASAGATYAWYTVLRLPLEVRDLFVEWLREFAPLRADHVLSRVRQISGGRDNRSEFGQRMTGTGIFAELLRQRFALACRRLGLAQHCPPLACEHFRVPSAPCAQQNLF